MDRRWIAAAIVIVLGGSVGSVGQPATAASAPSATATQQARRDIAFSPSASCDLVTARLLSSRHPSARQFVIVASDSWKSTVATLQIVARSASGEWRCQQSPVPAMVGKFGMRPLSERRSGDGTTPAGSFPLGNMQAWDGQRFEFFGNLDDPGVRGPYRVVRSEDCWGATPHVPSYQRLVSDPGCASPDERLMSFGDVYGHAAIIGANLDPISGAAPGEPALAAAIFLHRNSYSANGLSRPTSGCVSLSEDALEVALRMIDPLLGVQFAIGELSWLGDVA